MKEFIYSNQLSMLQFYGITIRIDVIIVDGKANNWIVTKRTCNKQNEETWSFYDMQNALTKYKDLIKSINTTWGKEISNLIK